jgi:uncharacterized protein involved in type VI secretion and phage assembly
MNDLAGVYRGVVVAADEHERWERVQIKIPAVSGDEAVWALVAVQTRRALIPDRGDEVVVAFEAGDADRPIVLGRIAGRFSQSPT